MAGRLSRRGLLTGGAAALTTLAAGRTVAAAASDPYVVQGAATEPFYGNHQAGIATPPQAHGVFVGLDLKSGTGRDDVVRLMKVLTDDARRLCQGQKALADTEPELAVLPARLTVTFGFGPGLYKAAKVGEEHPGPLPSFKVDKLQSDWSDGDLLVQVCCDDQLTLAHALRMILKDSRSFARVRWTQRGFRQAAQPVGMTQRNLMGQLDGTVNPQPGTPDFDRSVWIGKGPLTGGTTLVL